MSTTSFNLGAALQQYKDESEITILPPGTYVLEVTSAKAGKAAKGPTIMPVFKIFSGPDAGKRVMAGKISFSENALWKTFPILAGFGITQEVIGQANTASDPIKYIADLMVGRVAEVTLSIDNWQGQDRNRLDSAKLADVAGGVSSPAPVAAAPPVQPVAAAPVAEAAPAPAPAPAAAPTAAPAPTF